MISFSVLLGLSRTSLGSYGSQWCLGALEDGGPQAPASEPQYRVAISNFFKDSFPSVSRSRRFA